MLSWERVILDFIKKDADQLIDAINQEKNDAKRNELYKKFQVVVHQTLPYIFLYSPSERILISNRWQGSTNSKRPGYQANTLWLQANDLRLEIFDQGFASLLFTLWLVV